MPEIQSLIASFQDQKWAEENCYSLLDNLVAKWDSLVPTAMDTQMRETLQKHISEWPCVLHYTQTRLAAQQQEAQVRMAKEGEARDNVLLKDFKELLKNEGQTLKQVTLAAAQSRLKLSAEKRDYKALIFETQASAQATAIKFMQLAQPPHNAAETEATSATNYMNCATQLLQDIRAKIAETSPVDVHCLFIVDLRGRFSPTQDLVKAVGSFVRSAFRQGDLLLYWPVEQVSHGQYLAYMDRAFKDAIFGVLEADKKPFFVESPFCVRRVGEANARSEKAVAQAILGQMCMGKHIGRKSKAMVSDDAKIWEESDAMSSSQLDGVPWPTKAMELSELVYCKLLDELC